MLTGAKSFRAAKDAELIRRGADFAVLDGAAECGGRVQTIYLTVGSPGTQRPGRTARLNGVDKGRAASLAGTFTAVVFEPDHLGLIKGSPGVRPAVVLLEQGVFLGQHPAVTAQGRQIARVQLAQCRIQKAAAAIRAALDQRKMPGVKHHGGESARNGSRTATVCPVHPGGAPGALAAGQAHRNANVLLALLCLHRAFQHGKFGISAHQLGITAAAKAFAARKHPYTFQQIGFSLAVLPHQHRKLGGRGKLGPGNVAVILYRQAVQPHVRARTATVRPSSSISSPGTHFLPRMVQTSPFSFT